MLIETTEHPERLREPDALSFLDGYDPLKKLPTNIYEALAVQLFAKFKVSTSKCTVHSFEMY